MTAMCWPEQEAVWKWMKDFGIELTFEQEDALKKAVSAYRIEVQNKAQPKEPLTEREILDFWLARFDVEGSPINNFARAIEAAHGIIKTYPEKDKT